LCEVLTEAELLPSLGWQPSTVQDHTWCDTCHSAKVSEHTAERISKQPGIFERTCQSLLCQRLMLIEVSGHTFEHLVTIGNKSQHYFRILQWFRFISNLSQTHSDDPWPCKDACWPCKDACRPCKDACWPCKDACQPCKDACRPFKDACPANCCLTVNLGFGPSYLLKKIGNGVLPRTVQLTFVPKG